MSDKKFNLTQTGQQVQDILNSAKSTDQVLTEIQEAMENLPDGQAVSAQVALNTAAIQELDDNKASKTEVVFDISAYHATGGVLAKYADLTAALGTNGANIPEAIRKGGMSVKFVLSSDHKYVQYRLMANQWSTTVTDWQGVDDKPIPGSKNLAESGGVYGKFVQELGNGTTDFTSVQAYSAVPYIFVPGAVYYITVSADGTFGTRLTENGNNLETLELTKNTRVKFIPQYYANYFRIGMLTGGVASTDITIELEGKVYKYIDGRVSILSNELSELNEDINGKSYSNAPFTNKSIWRGNIGEAISNATSTYNDNNRLNDAIDVSESEMFYISLSLTGDGDRILFTDDSNIVVSVVDKYSNTNGRILTVPNNAVKMFVNFSSSSEFVLRTASLKEDILEYNKELEETVNGVDYSASDAINRSIWKGNVGEVITYSSSTYNNNRIKEPIVVSEGDFYYIVSSILGDGKKILFTDNNGLIISVYTSTINTNGVIVKVPKTATRMYVNYYAASTFVLKECSYDQKFGIINEEFENVDFQISGDFSNARYEQSSVWSVPAIGEKINIGTTSYSNNRRIISPILTCPGEQFKLTSIVDGINKRVVFTDKDDIVIGFVDGTDSLTTSIITVPDNCVKMYVNYSDRMSFSLYRYYGNLEEKTYISIFAPSPQLACNGSNGSDFNAESLPLSQLYGAFDSLIGTLPNPSGGLNYSPKYMNKNDITAMDASNQYELVSYILTQRDRYAFKAANRLYAWKSGNDEVLYSDSCSPRVGDVLYTDADRTVYANSVSSFNSTTKSIIVDGVTYTKYTEGDIDTDVCFTKAPISKSITIGSEVSFYDKNDTLVGNAVCQSASAFSINGKTYNRCESLDYHTNSKGTIFLWANEHAPKSDPMEPAVILYRMAKDLCVGCRNNVFLSYLKDNYKIVIIPCGNPYGLQKFVEDAREGRLNANGVNINRNYATVGWETVSDEPKGFYGGDQNETQYIMNMCEYFNADLAIDIHCLGYTDGDRPNGIMYYENGRNLDADMKAYITETLMGYGYDLKRYGYKYDPNTSSTGCSWIIEKGIAGGLIEMNAGECASSYNGNQHTPHVMEACYTTLLNMIRAWLNDVGNGINLSTLCIK